MFKRNKPTSRYDRYREGEREVTRMVWLSSILSAVGFYGLVTYLT